MDTRVALPRAGVSYPRVFAAIRVALRYHTAIVMLTYGGFKIVNSQFPPVQLDQMAMPLGALAPAGLLWNYMGYSPAYVCFTGIAEAAGALLLLYRRTTTLGALLLIPVLANVVLINFAYDVPAKGLALNLFMSCIVLAAPDARRIVSALVGPATNADTTFGWQPGRAAARLRTYIKPLLVFFAVTVPIGISSVARSAGRARSPLYGVWVITARPQSREVHLENAGAEQWRRLVFGAPSRVAIAYDDGHVEHAAVAIDSLHGILTVRTTTAGTQSVSYRRLGDTLCLRSPAEGAPSEVAFLRVDEREVYPLARARWWFGTAAPGSADARYRTGARRQR